MTARYREIAGALQERIATGEFDVGHLLPTEAELCEQFRASRFTIREALRRLDDAGLVARRQGSGTRVVSRAPLPRYVASLRNEADVLRYTAQTFLVPITGWGPASPKLRKELALNDDERWLALRAVRHLAGEGPAIGAATIAVLAELEPALASIDLSRPAGAVRPTGRSRQPPSSSHRAGDLRHIVVPDRRSAPRHGARVARARRRPPLRR